MVTQLLQLDEDRLQLLGLVVAFWSHLMSTTTKLLSWAKICLFHHKHLITPIHTSVSLSSSR